MHVAEVLIGVYSIVLAFFLYGSSFDFDLPDDILQFVHNMFLS